MFGWIFRIVWGQVEVHLLPRIPSQIWTLGSYALVLWSVSLFLHGLDPSGWWIPELVTLGALVVYRAIWERRDILIWIGYAGAAFSASWYLGPSPLLLSLIAIGVVWGAIWLERRPSSPKGEIRPKEIIRRWDRISLAEPVKRVLEGSRPQLQEEDQDGWTIRVSLGPGRSLNEVIRYRSRIESAMRAQDRQLRAGSLAVYPDDHAGCVLLRVSSPPPD